MKKVIAIAATLCLGALNMNADVIPYYGTSKIELNVVKCKLSPKLCAVVIIIGPEWPDANRIRIYNNEGQVVQEHRFRAYNAERSDEGITITWLP